MKSNYHEKRAAQFARFMDLAAKNEALSISRYETAKNIGSFIPMGQPILVGHHSEKRHRRDLAKIDNNMRASAEASEKAAYYANRAANIENSNVISSDNPDAVELLEAKLEKLLKMQDLFKAINKIVKAAKLTDAQKIEKLQTECKVSANQAAELLQPDFCGRVGIPSYKLSNNNGVIKNTRDRLARLKKIEALPETSETINGVRLVVSPTDNRVQMYFGGKPSAEIRDRLKRAGFRFSYTLECWQKNISGRAIHQARELLNSLPCGN